MRQREFPPHRLVRYPRLDDKRPLPRQIGTKAIVINGQEHVVRVFEPAGFAPKPDDAGLPVKRTHGRYYVTD